MSTLLLIVDIISLLSGFIVIIACAVSPVDIIKVVVFLVEIMNVRLLPVGLWYHEHTFTHCGYH